MCYSIAPSSHGCGLCPLSHRPQAPSSSLCPSFSFPWPLPQVRFFIVLCWHVAISLTDLSASLLSAPEVPELPTWAQTGFCPSFPDLPQRLQSSPDTLTQSLRLYDLLLSCAYSRKCISTTSLQPDRKICSFLSLGGHFPVFMHLPLQHPPGRLFLTIFHLSKSFISSDTP